MVDSDLDANLFGMESDGEEEKREVPDYIHTKEFIDFIEAEDIKLHSEYGFTQLKTFKPYYLNGQVVRGYGIFTLFNKVNAKDIYLRVTGYENCGENASQALKSFKKN